VSEAIGADWSEIAPALRLDRRIGPYAYLDPGLGISGGNLERDLRTVLNLGRQHATDTRLIDAWLANSAHRKDWPWRVLQAAVLARAPDACIAVLGLAYKENTHSTKNAPALQLLAHLEGRKVKVHDPVVPASVVAGVIGCATASDCVRDADAVVIATAWPEYRALSLETFKGLMRGRVLIDPLRALDGAKARALGFAYHTLGRPP
jgi:UDPglucose 6-dehydrogenase